MARKNHLDQYYEIIEKFLDSFDERAFTETKLKEVLTRHKTDWGIPAKTSAKKIFDYLINKRVLLKNNFLDRANESKLIYSWKTEDDFTIISGLKSNSYFVQYSAIYLHQLSLQIPKTIYLNFEHQSPQFSDKTSLTQESIDDVFSRSQRKSSLTFSFFDKKVIVTNGKYTNRLGVIKRKNDKECFEYTDLERTLIDISVRPVYAGGVFEVLEAFKLAKGKLNAQKMADYLMQLDFTYPYHQVIGFYMSKASYAEKDIAYFRKEMTFNFYLTYDIRNKKYSEEWRLYYPAGF